MVYGYGCVSSTKLHRKDSEALKRTKTYTTLRDIFLKRNLSLENIHIDLITGTYRKRKWFEWILEHAKPNDCIIITSLRSLGNVDEARANYMALFKKNLALLVEVAEQYPEEQQARLAAYSTAINYRLNRDLAYRGGGIPTVIVQNLEDMEEVYSWVSDNRGRTFTDAPEHFKDVYWLYENYFIAEGDTYHTPVMDISKKKFGRLAAEYETSPEYASDLKEQNRLYHIGSKPKRYGKVPDDFGEFLQMLDGGESLKTACANTGYHFSTMMEVNRYRLKYEGGRSAMALATRYRNSQEAKEAVEKAFKGDA